MPPAVAGNRPDPGKASAHLGALTVRAGARDATAHSGPARDSRIAHEFRYFVPITRAVSHGIGAAKAGIMISRTASAALLGTLAVLAGCSSGTSNEPQERDADPTAFTVSYRSHVRLPQAGETLSAEGYASQIKAKDPIASIRCGADESAAYKDVSAFLGGIAWSHPMAIIKDSSLPRLYDGKFQPMSPNEASAGASDKSSSPTIERPDLVGVQNGIAIFLSKQHGLMAVDMRGSTPVVSCSMKVPGEAKNFLFHGNELVIVVNARAGNRSALLRYSFDGGKFHFVDAVRFEDQTILDARLFDSTIVAYTSWSKPAPPPVAPTPAPQGSGGGGDAPSKPAGVPYYGGGDHLGSKILVVQWDSELKIDWEDALLDDVAKQDPLEGTTPGTKYEPGQLVSEYKTFKSFVTASDRYIVVPRDVQKTRFDHYETYNYQVCTSFNPHYQQVTQCSVNYEKRANPDYRAPDPATGDYSCNGKKLEDCIAAAAPVVSQFIYAPVGQTCNQVWQGRCEKYENRSETYPRFNNEAETELTIYRFEGGTFTKLDSSLAKMVERSGAIAFENNPLSVKGAIANKNQIQFQNGHLYVFADQALQTLSIAGNSIAYLNRLGIASSTTNNPSIAFSSDRAMISAVDPNSYSNPRSSVTMLDLTSPSIPKQLNGFTMPGVSTQLILANGGILGPGQVDLGVGNPEQMRRQLQKLTLFSKDAGAELDNLLLGTEYDTFETSWLDASFPQKIRLDDSGTRLFLPYSGRHHADQYEPVAHRLNISRIEGNRLVSERSFAVSDDIVRTAPIDANRSLVFGDTATYIVDKKGADWALTTLRELFVPFATYRMNDQSLHARIARVGAKCRITTHADDAQIFGEASLAQADVPCSENGMPIGFGTSVLFADTRTGVRVSADGRTIDPLGAAEVAALVAKIPNDTYCYIPSNDAAKNGSPIDFLDSVPVRVLCVPVEQSAATGGTDTAAPSR